MAANPLGEILEKQGLTREDLRFLARVSPSTIRAVERYGYMPGPEVRERITKALNVREEMIWPGGDRKRNNK